MLKMGGFRNGTQQDLNEMVDMVKFGGKKVVQMLKMGGKTATHTYWLSKRNCAPPPGPKHTKTHICVHISWDFLYTDTMHWIQVLLLVFDCLEYTVMTSSNWNVFRVTGPLCREFTCHRWISLTKDQWRGALMFYSICASTNGWANNRDACDLRHHCAHYDVTVMHQH